MCSSKQIKELAECNAVYEFETVPNVAQLFLITAYRLISKPEHTDMRIAILPHNIVLEN